MGEPFRYRDESCASDVSGVVSISPSLEAIRRRFLPNSITGPQTDPLGDGAVLLLSSGELDLGVERLLGLYFISVSPSSFLPSFSRFLAAGNSTGMAAMCMIRFGGVGLERLVLGP